MVVVSTAGVAETPRERRRETRRVAFIVVDYYQVKLWKRFECDCE
jgi:hypothetical protein